MANLIVILILVIIVGAAAAFIIREKKRGVHCIGCSSAGQCSQKNCGGCSGNKR